MGCGESKHAVSTTNTVVSKRSSSKRSNSTKSSTPEIDSPVEKTANNGNLENGLGNGKENGVVEVKKEDLGTDGETKVGNVESEEKEKEKPEVVQVVAEQEGQIGNVEVKEEAKDEVVGEEKEAAKAVPVPGSPDDFFSDQDTIDSVIADGISGKTEYHSPNTKHNVTTEKEDTVSVGESTEVVPVDGAAATLEEKPDVEKDIVPAAAESADDVKAI